MIDNISVHAEDAAVSKFFKQASSKSLRAYNKHCNLHLIVIRVNSSGQLKESMPCKNCVKILMKKNITRVTYSTSTGQLITCKLEEIEQACKYTSGDRLINNLKTRKNNNELHE